MSERLLVFAHQDEAQAFHDVPHLVTGIGKVRSIATLSRRLSQGDVSEVVVLGTAGLIDDSLDVDTVYRVASAIQHDFEFSSDTAILQEDAWVAMIDPEPLNGVVPAQASSGDEVPTATIATGDVFVKDDMLRGLLAAQGAHLVDMESYAYAVLCHSFQVRLRIFKIPSDFADSSTSNQTWDDIVAIKSEQLRQFAQTQALV